MEATQFNYSVDASNIAYDAYPRYLQIKNGEMILKKKFRTKLKIFVLKQLFLWVITKKFTFSRITIFFFW